MDSKAQDSGFQRKNFPDYAIRIALLGAIKKVSNDDFTFFFMQLFPQVGPVMIKPLREAYENYERMRNEEEAVKADAAESSPPESDFEGLKGQDINANGTQVQWSSKKLMGVSKEIRDTFHDKNKESKPGDEDTLSRPMIKTQVLNQCSYEIRGEDK